MDLSRQNGITTTSEVAFGVIHLPLEEALFKNFNDPTFHALRRGDRRETMTATRGVGRRVREGPRLRNTERLIFKGVKFFADDSFLSLGMVMEDPGYTDGREGLFVLPPGEMVETWRPWWGPGFHIHVHTNGNAGNQATVNALEA